MIHWYSAVIFEPGRAIGQLQKKTPGRASCSPSSRCDAGSLPSAICLWFTARLHRTTAGADSASVLLKSHLLCENREHRAARHLPHAGVTVGVRRPTLTPRPRYTLQPWNPTARRTYSSIHLYFDTHGHIRTRPPARGRLRSSEVQVSTLYSSTRVSPRPPVAVHIHLIAELLALVM